ncbi:aquaporin-1-like [Ictalurus punctatus]|uniref:Aquaporin-1-like n=1 Tax=Ictalurus punctatus TaxID=7998 RepID=A0A9F7RL30_ICTPU|nr:aquaporin-1-like [Ictalurus punctatus]
MTLFIFVSITAAIRKEHNTHPDQEVKVSLTFGLAIATLAQSLGHISGAHLNLAVTVGMLVSCQISILRAAFYILAQMLGATVASGIVYSIRPGNDTALGVNAVSVLSYLNLYTKFNPSPLGLKNLISTLAQTSVSFILLNPLCNFS